MSDRSYSSECSIKQLKLHRLDRYRPPLPKSFAHGTRNICGSRRPLVFSDMAASSYQLPPGRVDRSRESCDNDATSAELPKKKMRNPSLCGRKFITVRKKIGLLCGIAFCKQYGFVGHNAILKGSRHQAYFHSASGFIADSV